MRTSGSANLCPVPVLHDLGALKNGSSLIEPFLESIRSLDDLESEKSLEAVVPKGKDTALWLQDLKTGCRTVDHALGSTIREHLNVDVLAISVLESAVQIAYPDLFPSYNMPFVLPRFGNTKRNGEGAHSPVFIHPVTDTPDVKNGLHLLALQADEVDSGGGNYLPVWEGRATAVFSHAIFLDAVKSWKTTTGTVNAISAEAHVITHHGRTPLLFIPGVCVADKDNILSLVTSTVYHRLTLSVRHPVIGFDMDLKTCTARLVLGWCDESINGGLPQVHLATAPVKQASKTCGIFRLSCYGDLLRLTHFLRLVKKSVPDGRIDSFILQEVLWRSDCNNVNGQDWLNAHEDFQMLRTDHVAETPTWQVLSDSDDHRFNEEDAHIARQATIEANTGLEVLDTRFDNNITDDSREELLEDDPKPVTLASYAFDLWLLRRRSFLINRHVDLDNKHVKTFFGDPPSAALKAYLGIYDSVTADVWPANLPNLIKDTDTPVVGDCSGPSHARIMAQISAEIQKACHSYRSSTTTAEMAPGGSKLDAAAAREVSTENGLFSILVAAARVTDLVQWRSIHDVDGKASPDENMVNDTSCRIAWGKLLFSFGQSNDFVLRYGVGITHQDTFGLQYEAAVQRKDLQAFRLVCVASHRLPAFEHNQALAEETDRASDRALVVMGHIGSVQGEEISSLESTDVCGAVLAYSHKAPSDFKLGQLLHAPEGRDVVGTGTPAVSTSTLTFSGKSTVDVPNRSNQQIPQSPAAQDLLILQLFAEYATFTGNSEVDRASTKAASDRCIKHCLSSVLFLKRLGIVGRPVWGLIVCGTRATLIAAVHDQSGKDKQLDKSYVILRGARVYDLSKAVDAFQFAAALVKIRNITM